MVQDILFFTIALVDYFKVMLTRGRRCLGSGQRAVVERAARSRSWRRACGQRS